MSLKGNTKTMPLGDLLQFLAGRTSTGTLELVRGPEWKRIYFEKGKIISSGSSDPSEYLGHFLISENKITENQLTQAMEVQKKTKVMLGKILVMIGAVTEEELLKMLETKCKESLFSMFFWDEADFEFFDNQLPAVRLIPLSLGVDPLVDEALRRKKEWNLLRQTYPSRQIRFTKSSSSISDSVLNDPFLRTVYGLIDGKKSIADLVMQTHSNDYKVLRTVHELRTQNHIGLISGDDEAEATPFASLLASQIIEMGKNKLAHAKWEEAINLFSYVLQREDQNQEAQELLQRAEKGLVQSIYEKLIGPDSVPQLSKPMETLAKERLSSEESFVVTRINGRWDLKSILTVTPLREVDALRIVKRLLDRKIIEV